MQHATCQQMIISVWLNGEIRKIFSDNTKMLYKNNNKKTQTNSLSHLY